MHSCIFYSNLHFELSDESIYQDSDTSSLTTLTCKYIAFVITFLITPSPPHLLLYILPIHSSPTFPMTSSTITSRIR